MKKNVLFGVTVFLTMTLGAMADDASQKKLHNFTPISIKVANIRCGTGSCMDNSNICCSQGSHYWCCPGGSYCGNGGGCGH